MEHQDLELPWARRCRQVDRLPRGICRNGRLPAIRIFAHEAGGSGQIVPRSRTRVIPVIQQIESGAVLAGGTGLWRVADYS
jgi:hypothetical protein